MSLKMEKVKSFTGRILQIYLIAMFGAFPVYCSDGFFNIRHDRYNFYVLASMILLGITVLARLAVHAGGEADTPLVARHWHRRLSVTDWAMLGFLLSCMLSTLFSHYYVDALLGTAGRNNGLILMAIYVGVYFTVSRCERFLPAVFAVLGVASAFVGLVAVMNYFYYDPLKMLKRLTALDQQRFISTIGNKNFLASYFCITLPVLCILSVQGKQTWLRWCSLLCAGLSASGMAASDSDSALLGMAAFLAVYLIWYSRSLLKMKRFALSLTGMLLSVKCMGWLGGVNKGTGGIQSAIIFSRWSTGVLFLLALGTVVLYIVHGCDKRQQIPKPVRPVLVGIFGGGVLAVLILMLYFTFINPEVPLSDRWSVLRINEDWGTHRGLMWLRSMDIYGHFSLREKLFGSGPDTFYYAFKPYFSQLYQYGEGSTNAAHNEYIHYHITIGLVGVSCYLTAIISAIVRCVKRPVKDGYAPVFCAAVIGYAAQAAVNIAQPITTPLFFLFLALSAGRQSVLPPSTEKKDEQPPRRD